MGNLRAKLRGESPEKPSKGLKGSPKRTGKPAGKSAPKAKAKSASKASLLGDLDVNRKFMLAALGIAALAGVLAVTYLSDVSSGILQGGQKIKVYVATANLSARRQLNASMVEVRAIPKALLPEGALSSETDLVGKIVLAPVARGEILHKLRVSEASDSTGVSPKLLVNERGFLFVPEGANDIALVKPDDSVDLTATIQTPSGYLSTKVVQRVRILSVGNRFSNAHSRESGSYGNLLTLAVPSDKVALLTALKAQGNLSLSLREPGDTGITPPEIPLADLERFVMGHLPRPEPKPAPLRIAPPKPVVIYVKPKPVVQARPATPAPRPGIEVYSGTTLIHKKQP